MSPEERQLLSSLFERTRASASAPRDREAESLIDTAMREQPYAPYLLAQAVILQEKALEAASARIHELESEVARLHQQRDAAPAAQSGSFLGGLGSIFGSPQQAAPARGGDPFSQTVDRDSRSGQLYDDYSRNAPAPRGAPANPGPWQQPAPQYEPRMAAPSGPWGQSQQSAGGGSFLKGALGAAAGVAGGVLLADSLRGIFGSHMSGLGLGSPFAMGGQAPVEETIVNNYYMDDNRTIEASDNGNDDNGGFDNDMSNDDGDDSDYA